MGFEITGPSSAPVIVVLGGISSSSHVTSTAADPRRGWWEDFVGVGKAIDTERYRVLSIDYAAAGVPGEPVTTADQARRLESVLDEANVATAAAIVGASYGGMVALAFGTIAPHRVAHLIIIGAAHETAPIALAYRLLQRRIVAMGIETGRGKETVALARALAMTTYSSAADFTHRFAHEDTGETRRGIAEFFAEAGERFAATCPPERFLALSNSLDLHRVRPEEVTVAATVIAVHEDALVPVTQARALASRLGAECRLVELHSRHGHDTFLNAPSLIAPIVTRALERTHP